MVAVICYTAPAFQLLYNLATLGNVTSSVVNLDQLPLPQQTTLPDGYVAYPDLGLAYKYHNEAATWIEARNICQKEGAQLAVMDSVRKFEFFRGTDPLRKLAGIIRIEGRWVSVNTGLPLTSLPWKFNYPGEIGDCVSVNGDHSDLLSGLCSNSSPYACELPIRVSYTIVGN